MLAALQGRILGNSISVLEDITRYDGRTVTIIINNESIMEKASRRNQRLAYLKDFHANAKPTGRTAEEIDADIRELRDNDRL